MQLRKTVWMLTALSALSLVMTGCPGDEEGGAPCETTAECLGTEACHPTAKVCVETCTSGSDCPDTEKLCAPFEEGGTESICQCQTDALCNPDGGTDMVCSNLEKRCVAKCTSDANCGTDQTCNLTSGQCEETGTEPGDSCVGTSQSTCEYGQFCNNSTCEAAPVAPTTCENFPAEDRPAWSATTSSGPVIYEVSLLRFEENSANCGSPGDAFITRVRAYRTDADWPSTRSGVAGFFYVTTGRDEFDVVNRGLLIPNTGYNRNTSNLKDAEFQVALCRPLGSTTLQVGFYFTGGNPVCQQLTKP